MGKIMRFLHIVLQFPILGIQIMDFLIQIDPIMPGKRARAQAAGGSMAISSKFKVQSSKLGAGFTLIELLIVVAVIGILAAVIFQNFSGIRDRARDGERKSDMAVIQSALEIYRSDIGNYPSQGSITTSGVLNCNVAFTGGSPPNTYLRSVPCDPLNTGQHRYFYNATGSNPSVYILVSCLENTDDSEKDAGNDSAFCTGGTTNWSYTVTNP
jgi:general secretion pathway protein G